jgi:hypothetical protein
MQDLGDILVADFREIEGQIIGKIRVASGGRLLQRGQVVGGLIVEEGGQAEVHGQICRDVINNGSLNLIGQVVGTIHGNAPTNTLRSDQVIGMPLPVI